jgi:hypothetical protein
MSKFLLRVTAVGIIKFGLLVTPQTTQAQTAYGTGAAANGPTATAVGGNAVATGADVTGLGANAFVFGAGSTGLGTPS